MILISRKSEMADSKSKNYKIITVGITNSEEKLNFLYSVSHNPYYHSYPDPNPTLRLQLIL